jgi:hypothetical protein
MPAARSRGTLVRIDVSVCVRVVVSTGFGCDLPSPSGQPRERIRRWRRSSRADRRVLIVTWCVGDGQLSASRTMPDWPQGTGLIAKLRVVVLVLRRMFRFFVA